MGDVLAIGDGVLRLEDVERVSRGRQRVALTDNARTRMETSRALIERMIRSGDAIYGVTTGFGSRSDTRISPEELTAIQARTLRSHAAGAGEPLPEDVVRAAMFLRANMLAQGYSGVRPLLAEQLLALLNLDLTPLVPAKGSVGASGDLAPLAHLSLPLIGEGLLRLDGHVLPATDALDSVGLEPIELSAKEASSLVNGTEISLALAALAVADALRLQEAAEIAAAMTFQAIGGHSTAYREDLQSLRPHPGQVRTAARLRSLLQTEGGHLPSPGRRPIHDIYTLRCVPQVLGAVRTALEQALDVIEVELNSVTDNPVCIVESGEVLSGGNFHGHPLAVTCDSLKIAVASMGVFSERRIASLLDPRSSGLPELPTPSAEGNSGFLLSQYVAASLASENKVLAHPASVDSITTSAGAENYSSMSATAARHLRLVVSNTFRIIAIELACAAQALDLTAGEADWGLGVRAAHRAIREEVPFLRSDSVVLGDLLGRVEELIRGGIVQSVTNESLGLRFS